MGVVGLGEPKPHPPQLGLGLAHRDQVTRGLARGLARWLALGRALGPPVNLEAGAVVALTSSWLLPAPPLRLPVDAAARSPLGRDRTLGLDAFALWAYPSPAVGFSVDRCVARAIGDSVLAHGADAPVSGGA